MPSIGITGGIACGKSLATKLLANKLQIVPFDSDQEVTRLLDNNSQVTQELKQNLGEACYDNEGKVNRAYLRTLLLEQPNKKAILENILHPRLREQWQPQAIKALRQTEFFLAEIPLLYEKDLASCFDHIIVVAASKETQLQRLTSSRCLSCSEAVKLIELQLPLIEKMHHADYLLWNDGSEQILQMQIEELLNLKAVMGMRKLM